MTEDTTSRAHSQQDEQQQQKKKSTHEKRVPIILEQPKLTPTGSSWADLKLAISVSSLALLLHYGLN